MNRIIGNMFQIPNGDTLMQCKGIYGHGKRVSKMILNQEKITLLMLFVASHFCMNMI
jgi:hypothetical protein